MSATIKGIQPLKFGTTTCTGYVVEEFAGEDKTQELVIEDENGDICTQITNFGNHKEVTLSVIPKSAVTGPKAGDAFTYGEFSGGASGPTIRVLSVAKKHVRKDVEKWVIKGTLYPNVDEA